MNAPVGLLFRSIWDHFSVMMIVMRRYLVLEQIKSCYTVTAVPMTVVKNFESLSRYLFDWFVFPWMSKGSLLKAEEHFKHCLLKKRFTKYYSSVIITITHMLFQTCNAFFH